MVLETCLGVIAPGPAHLSSRAEVAAGRRYAEMGG